MELLLPSHCIFNIKMLNMVSIVEVDELSELLCYSSYYINNEGREASTLDGILNRCISRIN